MIYFRFLPIVVTYLFIGTEKIMYFSVFFPKQVNCPSNSSPVRLLIIIN